MRYVPVLIAALFVGCASSGSGMSEAEILSQVPVVNRAPGVGEGGAIPLLDRDEAEGRLRAARDAFLLRDYESCMAITTKALEDGAPAEVAQELKALRYDARRLLLSRKILEGRVLPERDLVAIGEPVVFTLVLTNVGGVPVEVARAFGPSSPASFVLDVVRQDVDIYGNVRAGSSRKTIELDEDLSIGVNRRGRIRFTLESGRPEDRHFGFSVMTVSGVFRPAVVRAGAEEYFTPVEVSAGEVRILPPGYEPIAADPMGTLDKAERLRAREHLLIAAELAPPERQREVLGKLIGYLPRAEPGMADTIMAALRRLTGQSFAARPDAWTKWWKEDAGGRSDQP